MDFNELQERATEIFNSGRTVSNKVGYSAVGRMHAQARKEIVQNSQGRDSIKVIKRAMKIAQNEHNHNALSVFKCALKISTKPKQGGTKNKNKNIYTKMVLGELSGSNWWNQGLQKMHLG